MSNKAPDIFSMLGVWANFWFLALLGIFIKKRQRSKKNPTKIKA